MAKVFEDFVTTALTEALRKHQGRTRSQRRAYLDEKPTQPGVRQVTIKPDIIHELDGKPVLIFDAKYKAASASGQYPNADHYQMLAYATAEMRREAWLVYAGGGNPTARKIRNSDITIHEFPIDLSKNPTEILARIESLSEVAIATVYFQSRPNNDSKFPVISPLASHNLKGQTPVYSKIPEPLHSLNIHYSRVHNLKDLSTGISRSMGRQPNGNSSTESVIWLSLSTNCPMTKTSWLSWMTTQKPDMHKLCVLKMERLPSSWQ